MRGVLWGHRDISTHSLHDDVIRRNHFPRYWPFVRGIHRPPVNSPHKGQWRGALMFSLICVWINSWINNREAGDSRLCRAHYDVIVMARLLCFNCDEIVYVQTVTIHCKLIICMLSWFKKKTEFFLCIVYQSFTGRQYKGGDFQNPDR